jgi:hypothetical protein
MFWCESAEYPVVADIAQSAYSRLADGEDIDYRVLTLTHRAALVIAHDGNTGLGLPPCRASRLPWRQGTNRSTRW